jgi:hypothetical protein
VQVLLLANSKVTGLKKDMVLNQVDGFKVASPVVERLEDDLSVVVGLEINYDELNAAAQHSGQLADTLDRVDSVRADPLADPRLEELASLADERPVRGRGVASLRGNEGSSVRLGRPKLEALMRIVNELCAVVDKAVEGLGCGRGTQLDGKITDYRQNHLHRG